MSVQALPTLALVVAAVFFACGCGGSSNASTRPSPTSATTTPPAPSPSPAVPSYSVNLTFTGGLSGSVTQTQEDANSSCAAGRIDINIVYRSQVWSMHASVTGYQGPGRYPAGLGASFTLMLDSPTFDIWTATGGSATYSSDTYMTIDVAMTNLMAGPGEPGATASISGTIRCG